jgi:protein-S-isoprenylcysteine O-methyltransferase Ste14
MASQLATAAPAVLPPRLSPVDRFTRFLVRRRVAISFVLFTALVALDVFVFRSRPRNVLDFTDPLVAPGELMILIGLTIRSWAAGTLRKRKQLASSGPYAWVRHPLYVGSFLMMVGFAVLVHDPLTIWIVLGPVAMIYWLAVRTEEQYLLKVFPHDWPRYAAAVPRFIPRTIVWPRWEEWSLGRWLHNTEYQAWLGSAIALAAMWLWRVW